MYGNLEELIKKISEGAKIDESEVKKLIEEKVREFSGLISEEGAAHIVAKEYGLNLLKEISKDLKIENIICGMKSVNVKGNIIRIIQPKEFERNGKKGKVASIIIGDETGQIRISLWDEQTDLVKNLEEGMNIEVLNAYTRDNGLGGCELRLGKTSKINKIDVEITPKKGVGRTEIRRLTIGSNGEIRGAIVQIFDTKPFFFVCPICGQKIVDNKCETHGEVEPKPILILSGVIDDGTGNMRIVFFREQAEKVIGMKSEEAFNMTKNGSDFDKLKEKINEILGKEFVVRGRTKQNQFFERLEFIATDVEEVDPIKEAKAILNSLERKE
ncbi:MAG: hypothetical protein J7L45_02610 [Candidatus Aenigmarchaeota archaeon]|nr:hypothetical protein [Candidatus Aenigmarchaeota archaeon]